MISGNGIPYMIVLTLLGFAALLRAPVASAQSSGTLAESIRPFVDKHELAGAVMLVGPSIEPDTFASQE